VNDPSEFFRPVDYKYLVNEQSKALTSKRTELSGKKGMKTIFQASTHYNPKFERDNSVITALFEKLKGKSKLTEYLVFLV
jgi:tyrosine-protein phosphatase YwqE